MRCPGIFFIVVLLLTGCRYQQTDASAQDDTPPVISDFSEEAYTAVDSVAASLSLRQKVGQLFMPALYASDDFWTRRQLREYADSAIGGIVLLKGDVAGAKALAHSVRHISQISPFIAIDAEWGLAMRLTDAPVFPDNSSLDPAVDDQLMYDYGRELARECRLIGINMVLGPVVDVSVPNGFMRRRSFGSDPARVADLAIAYARGLEDGDVISVAKHFPGHGSVVADSHKTTGVISRSLNEMDSIDLYPFRKWVEQRLSAVMVGHLAVPSIDPEMLPAAVSPTVIRDLLRNDLGFSGLVLTDAINMKGASGYGAVDAFRAGADIVLVPEDTFNEINRVVQAVEDGQLEITVIEEALRRVLFYKYIVGLISPGGNKPEKSIEKGNVYSPIADSISRRLSKHRPKVSSLH
ncbi:MAG: hypothetical protein K2G67_07995 [Muribaculaceae bacterium]|nr:hypothetical protein [Muribaculaceae bacterium]